jgi:hypothetical protein
MCLLSPSISKPQNLRLSIKDSIVNSKAGKLKKHNVGDEQPNIDFAIKKMYYTSTTYYLVIVEFFSLHVLNSHSIFGS